MSTKKIDPKWFFLLFLLSGITGLTYEILWVRLLSLVLGASSYAVTIVLATFMFGLGMGAWVVGRLADANGARSLARWYILLEIGIGGYALLFPAILQAVEGVYVTYFQAHQPGPLGYYGLKLLLSFLILAPPTILLGATLPVLSKYLIHQKERIALTIANLYAANTVGAIIGTVVTGYVLLPAIGIRASLWGAAGLNFLVAAAFWALSTAAGQETAAPAPAAKPPGEKAAALPSGVPAWVFIWGFGLSGMAAMFYEVAWTRTLCMILGTTTYAFTTMLAVFLLGIALGSVIYRWLPASWSRTMLFVVLQVLIGFSVLLTIPAFEKLPFAYLSLHEWLVADWLDIQLVRFLLAAVIMLVPTLAMGTLFPVVSALFVRETEHLGGRLGKAYAFNTFGGTLGATAAGLLLVPLFGMQQTIVLGAILNLASGAAILLLAPKGRFRYRNAALAGTMLAAAFTIYSLAPWSPKVMSSGPYIYAPRYGKLLERYQHAAVAEELLPNLSNWQIWELAMKQYQLLFYHPGPAATVAVMERKDGVRFLTIDGKTDASTGMKSDMRTQSIIGHLPLLFHPDPDQVLVVGLGSGVTAGAVLTHQVRMVDCAEISPGVIEASRYFDQVNHQALDDPRLRIAPQDARNMLLTSQQFYDVIISQPSNPWISGESSLFALEWYQQVRDHLRQGGLFLQWVPSYLMSRQDLKIIVHTLRSVFPHLTLWHSGSVGDLILLASKDRPLRVDYPSFLEQVQNKEITGDLERVGLDPQLLPFELFVMQEPELSEFLYADLQGPLPRNTDDRLISEFSTPRQLFLRHRVEQFATPERLGKERQGLMQILQNVDDELLRSALSYHPAVGPDSDPHSASEGI